AGSLHTRTSDPSVSCWGRNKMIQFGNSLTVLSGYPNFLIVSFTCVPALSAFTHLLLCATTPLDPSKSFHYNTIRFLLLPSRIPKLAFTHPTHSYANASHAVDC